MIEIFDIRNELSPLIVRELFNQRINNYNFLGLKLWDIVSTQFKKSHSLSLFKKAIKNGNLKLSFPAMQDARPEYWV